MNSIIPTIFSHNKKEFFERMEKLLPISRYLQIDFMDGKFVPSISVNLRFIPNLSEFQNFFEAHLMVSDPLNYITKLHQRGFSKIIFHFESYRDWNKILIVNKKIKSLKMMSFLAINPETPENYLFPYLKDFDGFLFMGVHPGKEHQKFIKEVYQKIKRFRKKSKSSKIQVDGGINFSVAKRLAKIGVNYLNTGSLVSSSENPKETLKNLKKTFLLSKH